MKTKKSKLLKSLGFTSLALLMGAAGVFAFAPLGNAPMSPNSLNASATTQGQTFDLGLNPATDPVVYTTESGLEIKMNNGKGATTTVTSNTGYTYTQDLTGLYYFTMGNFSGTIYTGKTQTDTYTASNVPVNWLIIGRGPGFNFEKSTPAGTSLVSDRDKQEIAASSALYLPNAFTTVPENSEIPAGCFLVISEKSLGTMYFNSTGALNYGLYTDYAGDYQTYGNGTYGCRYRYKGDLNTATIGAQTWNNKTDGSLYAYINSLFSKNISGTILKNGLGFTQAQADLIVPQQLYTSYCNGKGYPLTETPSTDGGTYYTMFPLATRSSSTSGTQNYCIEDYLTTNTKKTNTIIGCNLVHMTWTRSGSQYGSSNAARSHGVSGYDSNNQVSYCYGARPAMVLKIVE